MLSAKFSLFWIMMLGAKFSFFWIMLLGAKFSFLWIMLLGANSKQCSFLLHGLVTTLGGEWHVSGLDW